VGTVVEAGKSFRRLAHNPLGERTLASLAVVDGTLILRSEHAVYRIGSPTGGTAR